MKTRILHAVAAAGLSTVVLLAPPARADHPWQDAPHAATILSDHTLADVRPDTLIALADGRLAALDGHRHPVLIGPDDVAGTFPAKTVPTDPLVSLTRDGASIWGLTSENAPALVRLGPDGALAQRISVHDATLAGSSLIALAVRDGHAYLADEARPAIVVIDLATGSARRLLSYDASLTGRHPLMRAGKPELAPDHHPSTGGNVRFLALDPKGEWLFYQAACGPLYSIDKSLLTDSNYTPVEQLEGITQRRTTPSVGGLTLTDDGTFYFSDIEIGSILKLDADHVPLRIIRDTRLTRGGAIALTDSAHIAVLVTEHGTTHILRIALP